MLKSNILHITYCILMCEHVDRRKHPSNEQFLNRLPFSVSNSSAAVTKPAGYREDQNVSTESESPTAIM